MAYYYVKNGGTATGDAGRYASQQSGSFASLGASNYYNDIVAAEGATTTPVAGDFINPSDMHVYTQSAQRVIGIADVLYVSVDDVNIDAGRTVGNRAKESVTGTGPDFTLNPMHMSGIEITSEDKILIGLDRGTVAEDCKFLTVGTNDGILMNGDGRTLRLINCEVSHQQFGNIEISNASTFEMFGGVITTATTIDDLFERGFSAGGGVVKFYGVDLSVVTGTLIASAGGVDFDDLMDIRFDMCKIASGVAFTNETFTAYNHRALFTRCSDSSAAAEYQYHLHAFGGDVDDDSSIFRNEDPAFEDSGQKISYKIVTNSDASLGSPLWFKFPIKRWAELSTATNTIRFHIASDTALTNKMLYPEVIYPDATNKQTPTFLSGAPLTVGGTLDLMAPGTALTVDGTSTWTNAPTFQYVVDLQLASGSDTVPIVKWYCTEPSVTIQIAAKPEMV